MKPKKQMESKEAPKVSIVVPSYNRKNDLLECLQSIQDNQYPNLEVVVALNGCIDGSEEAVKASFPQFKVISVKEGLGSAKGTNLGIKNVSEDADYLFLLDDDTVLGKDAIGELVNAIDGKPEYGAATAKVLFFENPRLVQWAGTSVGLFTGINYMNSGPDDGRFDKFIDTEGGIGGTGLIKMEAVKKIGYFYDERYYYYYEDPDYAMRIIKAGYKILYVPTSKMLHKIPLLSKKEWKKRWFQRAYWVSRNKIIFMRKHSKCFLLFALLYPAWFCVYTYQAVRYLDYTALLNFYRGIIAGFKWALFDYRRENQNIYGRKYG